MNVPSARVAISEGEALSRPPAARHDTRLAIGLLVLATAYATLRYNVFKAVPWADWPAYIVNKAIAVTSLIILVVAVSRLVRRGSGAGILMMWSGGLALAHSLLSFALFDPTYYPRLFEAGKLTFLGGISMTLGVGLMALMELGARRSAGWTPDLRRKALAYTAAATGLHAALPAVPSWNDPSTWPGGMPPLTLISFIAGLAALAVWRFGTTIRASVA